MTGRIGGGKGSLKRITPFENTGDKIDCSPDGSRILFSTPGTDTAQSGNVYTVKSDGTGLLKLTHNVGGKIQNGPDSWSPDGRKIAFVSNRTGTFEIYSMNGDGTHVAQITHGPEAHLASWGSHP